MVDLPLCHYTWYEHKMCPYSNFEVFKIITSLCFEEQNLLHGENGFKQSWEN